MQVDEKAVFLCFLTLFLPDIVHVEHTIRIYKYTLSVLQSETTDHASTHHCLISALGPHNILAFLNRETDR